MSGVFFYLINLLRLIVVVQFELGSRLNRINNKPLLPSAFIERENLIAMFISPAPLPKVQSIAIVGATVSGGRPLAIYNKLKDLGSEGSNYPVNPRKSLPTRIWCLRT